MMRDRGIAFKLIVSILASCLVIFAAIFGYNYLFSRKLIIRYTDENARDLAAVVVNRIETVLRSVEKVPDNLAFVLESGVTCDKKEILALLAAVVAKNPEIYGSTIAFEPYAFDKDALYFAPYYYKSGGGLKFTYIGGPTYQYFTWDWYQIPKELGHSVWSEPYYDEGAGNIIMATYSAPFYRTGRGEKEFMGVVTADISLSWLEKVVSSIKVCKTGYGFLISRHGTIVTHPEAALVMHESIFSVAEARGDGALREIGKKMIAGGSGFVSFTDIVTGKESWLVYTPVPSSGWSLGVVFPKDELMAGVTQLNYVVLLLGIIGGAFLFIVIIVIARSITRPLTALAKATERIGEGNLDIAIPPALAKDETGKLTDSINYMRTSLKQYIRDLTEAAAERERAASELKIAHDIQMGILPKTFPAFPDRPEFDIYATIEPAKEVGGDLYDFFLIDDRHLCFLIGDVSGKGVPASLFMAITKTLVKSFAAADVEPGALLARVNRELFQENDSFMFVTVFCGILNIATGQLLYSNGGHNPPLLIRKGGAVAFLKEAAGSALGIIEEAAYTTGTVEMGRSDALFLYTDGVVEAMNEKKELFSEERLESAVTASKEKAAKELTVEIMGTVKAFAGGEPPSDDITILTVRYFGR